MSQLARQIVASGKVVGPKGGQTALTAETSIAQCEFLVELIKNLDAKICLEVGLAFGISSLFICDAIKQKSGAKLISIDKFQKEGFADIGLFNLERAGFKELVEFHRDYSYNVLPRLLTDGVKLDFAYVDSTKVFDVLLVDAFFLARLLRVGGIMAFDDCNTFGGPRRLARYLSKVPNLRVCNVHNPQARAVHGRKFKLTRALLSKLPHAAEMLRDEVVNPAESLGINAQCVAFEKTGEDDRGWKWYEDF